jgi:hypothetical protein
MRRGASGGPAAALAPERACTAFFEASQEGDERTDNRPDYTAQR